MCEKFKEPYASKTDIYVHILLEIIRSWAKQSSVVFYWQNELSKLLLLFYMENVIVTI